MSRISSVAPGIPVPYALPVSTGYGGGLRYQSVRRANGLPLQLETPGHQLGGYGPLLHDVRQHHERLIASLFQPAPPRLPPRRRNARNSSGSVQENRPSVQIEELEAEDGREMPRSERIPDGLDDLSSLVLARFDQIGRALAPPHDGSETKVAQLAKEAVDAAEMMIGIIDSAASGDRAGTAPWRSQGEQIRATAKQIHALYETRGGAPAAAASAEGTHRREAAAIIREMRMALRQLPVQAGPPSKAWANTLAKAGSKLQHLAAEVGEQNTQKPLPQQAGHRAPLALRLAAEGSGHASALFKASKAQAARAHVGPKTENTAGGYRTTPKTIFDPEFWRHAHSVMSGPRLDLGHIIASLERLAHQGTPMAASWPAQWPQTRFAYNNWFRGPEVRL